MNALTVRFLSLVLMIVGAAPLAACAYSGGPVEGQVLEEGSNKAIAGAIVIVRWQGSSFGFADSQTVCIHVESATTNDRGRYRTPAWRAEVEPAGVHHIEPSVTAHKAGYQWSSALSKTEEIQYLKPFTGGRGERLKYLSRMEYATRCPNAGTSDKNMLPFYRALYEEAKSLAVTKDDQKDADGFLSNIEMIELGYDAAMKRAIERAEKRKQQP